MTIKKVGKFFVLFDENGKRLGVHRSKLTAQRQADLLKKVVKS